MKTIKKQLKRAFTIVELVIVIAVVAALAAVLIPTFVSVVKSANETNDMVLAKYLDESLINVQNKLTKTDVTDENGNYIYNVTEAITLVRNDGYDVSKLTPTADDADYVYNASTNRFLYYTDDFTALAYGEEPASGDTLIVIDNDLDRVDEVKSTSSLLKGATIQYCVYNIEGGELTTDEALTIWYYSESGKTTITAENSVVYRYGTGDKDVASVDENSYHLYGKLNQIVLRQGHLDIKNENSVKDVILEVSTENNQPYVTGRAVEYLVIDTTLGTEYTKENNNTVTTTNIPIKKDKNLKDITGYGTANDPYVVNSDEDLVKIATYSNNSTLTLSVKNDDGEYTTATATKTDGKITLEGTFPESYLNEMNGAGLTVDVGDQTRKYVSDDGKANYVDYSDAVKNSALRIDTVYYQSFTALGTNWGSTSEDWEITLLKDMDNSVAITINENSAVTLDLNGCSLTMTCGTSTYKNAFTLSAGSSLTITDSSADGEIISNWDSNTSYYLFSVAQDSSVLTLESGTIQQNKTKTIIRVSNGGTFNMKGGKITCTGTKNIINGMIYGGMSTEGIINISGGTIENTTNTSYAIKANAGSTVNISGGTIKCTKAKTIYASGSNGKNVSINVTGCDEISGDTYGIYCAAYADVVVTGEETSIGTIYLGATTCSALISTSVKNYDTIVAVKSTLTIDKVETDNFVNYGAIGPAYIVRSGEKVYYNSLQSAVANADNNETVYLKANCTEAIAVPGKTITIDLNGYSLTSSGTYAITANSGADLKIINTGSTEEGKGVISSDSNAILIKPGATVTVEKNATVTSTGSITVLIGENDESTEAKATLNIYGTITNTGKGVAISGDGDDKVGGTAINIYEGATVTAALAVAIYHPQYGTVTVKGGTISGYGAGIQMCGGSLYISGDTTTISSTITSEKLAESPNGIANKSDDGAISDGAAVSIINRSGYVGITKVEITGGTFTSASNEEAIQVYSYEGNNVKVEWADKDTYVTIENVTIKNTTEQSAQ